MRLPLIGPRVRLRSALTGVMLALAALGQAALASAATLTWGTSGTGGGGTWTNANAWWNGSQQTWNSGTPDDAVFGGTGGAVALAGGTTTVGGITFNTFTGSYTIGTASQTLVINSGITMNSGAGAVTIQNSPITLGAAQSWTNNSASLFTASSGITNGGNLLTVDGSGNTTLSGAIAGTGGITKTGNGRLMLSGVNTTYSGTTTVNGGLLTSNTATTGVGLSSFGTGPIVIGSSGTVQLTGSNGGVTSVPYSAWYASGYTNTVSGAGTLSLVSQSNNFSVNYSGDLSGFTGTVSATSSSGQFVGYGSSTTPSLNATGSNAKFVVSGAFASGGFVGVLGATGTLALGELSGNGTIYSNVNYGTTWEIGGLSTSSTFSGRIANNTVNTQNSSLRKVGSGTLTLSGSNSYSGATTVVGGVLQLSNSNALSASTPVNVAGGTLDLQNFTPTLASVALTSGSIIGSGTLTAATYSLGGGSLGMPLGAGTLNVTGNASLNTTAAVTTVSLNSGTLTLGSGGRFTSSSVAVTGVAGGGLALGGNETFGSLSGTAGIALGSNTLSVGGLNTTTTYSGIMSGGGNLTKDGTGTLTLSGVNTYSGTTTINGGLLTSPANASGIAVGLTSFGSSAIVIGSSGTVRLTGWNGQSGVAAYYAGGYTNTVSGSGTLQLVGSGNNNMSVNYSGDLSGFTGTVSATTAALTFVGVGSTTDATLNMTGSNTKFVVQGAGSFFGILGATGTIALGELSGNGAIQANRDFNTTWEIGGLSTSSTFSGGFGDNTTGKSSLRKVGSGTLTLSGSSSFAGPSGTQLVAGGLTLGNANALGAAANPLAVNGGTLDLGGQSVTVGLLTGSAGGTITSNVVGTGTLTTSSASAGTFAGSIADGLGTVAFAKAGSGTFTLSGSNTYTGATTISAGRLSLVGNGVLGSGSYAGAIANAGELSVGSDVPQILSGAMSGTGSLTKAGSGTLTLSGSNSFTGGTRINAGVLAPTSPDAIGSSGTISFGGGTLQFSSGNTADYSSRFSTAASQAFNFDTNGQTVTLSTGLASTGGSLTKLGSGTLSLSGSNAYTGATTISEGVLQIGTGGTTGSLATTSNASVASGATLAFNRSDSLTYSGTVSGGGSIIKLGSNTLTLSAANTFAGGATINEGLVIGSNRSSFGTGTIALGASGTAQFTAQASGTSAHPFPAYYSNGYTNAATGSGVLRLVSGATTYSVNYSGDLSSFTGTVSATNASGQYTGFGNTTNPALNLTGSNTKFLVSGSGQFLAILTSSGTIVMGELSGDGTIVATNSNSAGLNTTWQIGSLATSSTYSGRFNDNNQGKSILAKVGSGTLTLSGSSTYSGGTQLNAGTLVVSNTFGLGTSTVTFGGGVLQSGFAGTLTNPISIIASSGTFDSQSNANTLSGAISGSGGFVKVGSGTLTLSATNSFTGTTRIGVGTLTVGNAASLSTSTVDMNAGDAGTITFNQNSTLGGLTGSRDLDMGTRVLSIGNNGQSTTYSGVLSNGGLTKVGSGGLTLSASSSYTGATTISGGRLEIASDGRINGTSGITINGVGAELKYNSATALTRPITFTQGTLSGTGTIGTAVTAGANDILSPGNSPGSQSFTSGLTWGPAGTYLWEMNDATGGNGTGWDIINVSGGSGLVINATSGTTFKIAITSLSGTAAGNAANFSATTSGSWTISSASGISGFAANKFNLDRSAFTNTSSGSFTISQVASGTNQTLVLAYNTISALSSSTSSVTGFRVMQGQSTTTAVNLLNGGPDATGYSLSPSAGLSLPSGSTGTVAASGTQAITFGYASTVATGARSGTVSFTNTGNAGDTGGSVSVSGAVVTNRVVTASAVDFGLVHLGASGTATSSFTSTGSDNDFTRITVNNGTGGGLTVSGNSDFVFNGSGSGTSSSRTVAGTFATAGALSGTISLTNSSAEAGGTLPGQVLGTTGLAYSASVFSGTATWNAAGGGSWGTQASGTNWTSAGNVQAAPGTFTGYANTDMAIFAGTQGGTSTVLLNGATPSLTAISFTNTANRYVIDQGSGGSLTLATSSGRPTINVASGGLHEIKTAILGSTGLAKLGGGTLMLSGSSGFTGGTDILAGALAVNGSIAGAVNVATDAILGGSGAVAGALTGAGLVSPGNSPGILTAGQFDPSGGLDAAFEFTGLAPTYNAPTGSVNDVLRLTNDSDPFASTAFTAANVIDVYFNVDSITSGQIYEGGFFTGLSAASLLSALEGKASFNYWAKTTGTPTRSFGGFDYVSLTSLPGITGVTLQTSARTADFGSGDVNGSVTQFVIVPEPAALALVGIGFAVAAWRLRRRCADGR